jgi:hypothetical protein
MPLSLIDAHKVFLIDLCNKENLYHHDIHISTSDHGLDIHYLLQSALEFALHTPQSSIQFFKKLDENKNECIQVVLENWLVDSKLICSIYDIRNYPATSKEEFGKFLMVQDITPVKDAIEHFKEFLGDDDLLDDHSRIERVTIEKGEDRCIYELKSPMNLTSLSQKLLELAISRNGSLVFKVNTYPYFEIQYPDRTTTGVWLNIDVTAISDLDHEVEGI